MLAAWSALETLLMWTASGFTERQDMGNWILG